MISDPAPTCGPTTDGPFMQNDAVTLECKMTYYFRSGLGARPRATITAAVNWQGGIGATTSHIDVINADESITMQVIHLDVQTFLKSVFILVKHL